MGIWHCRTVCHVESSNDLDEKFMNGAFCKELGDIFSNPTINNDKMHLSLWTFI